MAATAPNTYANHVEMHWALDSAPALRARGMGIKELGVLMVIARHINRNKQSAFLSYQTIADEAVCSRSTAHRAVEALTQAGVVHSVGKQGQGRVNIFQITYPATVCQPDISGVSTGHSSVCQVK